MSDLLLLWAVYWTVVCGSRWIINFPSSSLHLFASPIPLQKQITVTKRDTSQPHTPATTEYGN